MDAQALFTALKTRYPQSGLSDNEILGIATGLFATGLVTDENVDAIVGSQENAMKGYQSLFDSRFTSKKDALAKALAEQNEKTFREKYHINKDGKQETQEPPKEPDDIMAKMTKLLDERLKPLSDKFATEEAKKAQEERTAKILEAAKAHGIREDLAKMLNVPGDVTDLDSFMKDEAQTLANLGFQPSVPPRKGEPSEGDGKNIAAIIKAGATKQEPKK